jgi:hypothetical protein
MASAAKHSKSGVKSSKSSDLAAGPSTAATAGMKRSRDQIGASANVAAVKVAVGSKRKATEQETAVKAKKQSKGKTAAGAAAAAAGATTKTVQIVQKAVSTTVQTSTSVKKKVNKTKQQQQQPASDAKQPKIAIAANGSTKPAAAAAAAAGAVNGTAALSTKSSLYKSKHLSAVTNVKTVVKTKALVVKQTVATSASSRVDTLKWKVCVCQLFDMCMCYQTQITLQLCTCSPIVCVAVFLTAALTCAAVCAVLACYIYSIAIACATIRLVLCDGAHSSSKCCYSTIITTIATITTAVA